jgi:hypothetical protein
MSTVRQIEDAIKKLDDKSMAELREWFAEFDADQWDRQFEADVASGRLDKLVEAAMRDSHDGKTTEL